MNKAATWILTDTRRLFFHDFTCSECGRVVSATKHFNDKGHYDMTATVKELMKDYPYCHCGAKMNKDPQIRVKMSQMKKTHKLAVATWLTNNPIREKECWHVGEIIEEYPKCPI